MGLSVTMQVTLGQAKKREQAVQPQENQAQSLGLGRAWRAGEAGAQMNSCDWRDRVSVRSLVG